MCHNEDALLRKPKRKRTATADSKTGADAAKDRGRSISKGCAHGEITYLVVNTGGQYSGDTEFENLIIFSYGGCA